LAKVCQYENDRRARAGLSGSGTGADRRRVAVQWDIAQAETPHQEGVTEQPVFHWKAIWKGVGLPGPGYPAPPGGKRCLGPKLVTLLPAILVEV